MRKKILVFAVVTMMSLLSACGTKNELNIQPDTKPEETETTKEDIVGDDSEEQQSSKDEESQSVDNTEESSENQTTTDLQMSEKDTDKNSQTTALVETNSKPQNTTTKATENKKEPTTTSAPATTVPVTTAPATTNKEFTTGGGMTWPNDIKLDISVSESASAKGDMIVSSIITANMNAYDRVKAIHDYLVKNVDYDYNGLKTGNLQPSVYTAEGALCNGLAVCQGYAEAFELLCAKAGVKAQMVYGDAGNSTDGWQSHAWNVVRIDGEWYQIDCTWDDPLVDGEVISNGENIFYAYFLLTDSEMYTDHIVDYTYSKNVPSCTSTLFAGYSTRLSVDARLGQNGVIVSSAEEFVQVVQNKVASGIYNIEIAVPVNTVDLNSDMLNNAVIKGFNKAQKYGSYSIGTSIYPNVCGYDVIFITIIIS